MNIELSILPQIKFPKGQPIHLPRHRNILTQMPTFTGYKFSCKLLVLRSCVKLCYQSGLLRRKSIRLFISSRPVRSWEYSSCFAAAVFTSWVYRCLACCWRRSLNGCIVMSAVAADSPVAANAAAASKTKKVTVYQKIITLVLWSRSLTLDHNQHQKDHKNDLRLILYSVSEDQAKVLWGFVTARKFAW